MTTRLTLLIASVLAVVFVIGYIIHRERQDAADDALKSVRENNERLGREAETGALEYDDCRRAGRLWNYERNRCGGATTDRRN